MIKYTIFDMDGTLLDSMHQWRNVLYEYVKAQNYNFISDELIEELMGQPAFSGITKLIRDNGYDFDEEAAQKGILRMMAHHYVTDIKIKDGVPEVLEQYRRAGVPMCVITATAHRECEEALRYHGLFDYFDFILTDEDFPRGKYGEEIFLEALSRFGAAPGDTLLFDDALYSLKTGKRVGLRLAGVEDETQADHRAEIYSISDIYIRSFSDFRPGVTDRI